MGKTPQLCVFIVRAMQETLISKLCEIKKLFKSRSAKLCVVNSQKQNTNHKRMGTFMKMTDLFVPG